MSIHVHVHVGVISKIVMCMSGSLFLCVCVCRFVTSSAILDYRTVVSTDKFGNIAVVG